MPTEGQSKTDQIPKMRLRGCVEKELGYALRFLTLWLATIDPAGIIHEAA
jgi:hypothetical protein